MIPTGMRGNGNGHQSQIGLVAVAGSAGGSAAIGHILARLPADFPSAYLRVFDLTNGEHAFLRQGLQHLRRGGGPWAIVESQDDLVIFERQGLRKALQADPRCRGRIDVENALSPERILVFALRRLG